MANDPLGKIVSPLLMWYDRCRRSLPWRETRDPYRVWVSETMLQQTRVETVLPYYQRFLQALPTVADLAQAPEDQLLKLWEGLGYYSRVRSLQKAARLVLEVHGGRLPETAEALQTLPGIGPYTAGAVASIAFGQRIPAVDGNVLRVTARLLNDSRPISDPAVKADFTRWVGAAVPAQRPGDFNQALMDLGAMVCLPGPSPRCDVCPLHALCLGAAAGTAGALPEKGPRSPRKIQERTVFVLLCGDRAALRRRPESGLLAGLWELPAVEEPLDAPAARATLSAWGLTLTSDCTPLPPAKHLFTHVEWRMTAFAARVAQPHPDFTWADRAALLSQIALPSAFRTYRAEILARLTPKEGS